MISEYFKITKIGCCMVLGSVEDEHCFSTLKFLKSCQKNRLRKYLPLVVKMFGQKYFSLDATMMFDFHFSHQYPPPQRALSFHEIMPEF